MSRPMKSPQPISIHCEYENPAFTISYPSDEKTRERVTTDCDILELKYSPGSQRKGRRIYEFKTKPSENPEKCSSSHEHDSFQYYVGDTRHKNNEEKDQAVSVRNGTTLITSEAKSPTGKHNPGNNPKKKSLMSVVKTALLTNGKATGETEQACKSDKPVERGGSNEQGAERETWGKKIDFLLSIIGFAVDLGNVWRFPYICYKNGGGAFLIPYTLMLIFLGLPLFYMELALGQFQRCGAVNVWQRICPMFSGIGYGIILVATFVGFYYNTVIAWSLFYMVSSFRSELPWARCNNDWNTDDCLSLADGYNKSSITNTSVPAAAEYFVREVLEMQKAMGIEYVGPPKWQLVLCLMGVFVIVYFSLWKGIKSSGKAVWVTATVPYVVLLILLVRGCTLPGAKDGIMYYLTPKWHRLLDINVWLDATAQIFFSLGPGFGTLLALSSYNNFHNNCYFDAIAVSIINCLTSFLAGFVVFSVLGYMAFSQGKNVDSVATEGPGLVFVVYPEVIATLDGSVFWSIIFFLMLITLGLDSTYGGLEAVITALCDNFPFLRKRRKLVVLGVVFYCFLGALPSCTYGGQYVINLLDRHAAPISLVFICFVEAIAVNWFYGVQKFSKDIESMLGFQPGIFWKICWVGICPICLLVLFILSCWAYTGIQLDTYVYPDWSIGIGWCITGSSLICIPIYIVYKFIVTPGTVKQKILRMIKPETRPKHVLPLGSNHVGADFYELPQTEKDASPVFEALSNSTTVESYIDKTNSV